MTPWTSDQLVARPLPKHRTRQTQFKHVHTPNVHALSGIQTHNPSVRASENSSCLRPLGYCDRLVEYRSHNFCCCILFIHFRSSSYHAFISNFTTIVFNTICMRGGGSFLAENVEFLECERKQNLNWGKWCRLIEKSGCAWRELYSRTNEVQTTLMALVRLGRSNQSWGTRSNKSPATKHRLLSLFCIETFTSHFPPYPTYMLKWQVLLQYVTLIMNRRSNSHNRSYISRVREGSKCNLLSW
jgi:hypothetical protein